MIGNIAGHTMKIDSLSAVIPVYNEEQIIKESISLLASTLEGSCKDYEIVIIDDGSQDGTANLLSDLVSNVKGLKIIRSSCNQGLGAALKKGFLAASKDLVFYIDADMPFDYAEIVRAADMLEKNNSDLVVGYRSNRATESCLRKFSSMTYNWLISSIFDIRVKDINCAFKLIRNQALKEVHLKATSLFIDAELLIKCQYQKCRIMQMGLEYYPRQGSISRLFKPQVILHTLFEVFKYYPEITKLRL